MSGTRRKRLESEGPSPVQIIWLCPSRRLEKSINQVSWRRFRGKHTQLLRLTFSGHEDIIQDVAYGISICDSSLKLDFYGKRLATCSSDRTIHVFNHNIETQSWILSASWKAHDAAILRVCIHWILLTLIAELGTSSTWTGHRVVLSRSDRQGVGRR